MQGKNEKVYLEGRAYLVEKNGKEFINFDLKPEQINHLPVNKAGFVQLSMIQRQKPGKFGETHYIVLNQYTKPDNWEYEDEDQGINARNHPSFNNN